MSDDKTRARKPLDELGAMRRIGVLLAEQEEGAQRRIFNWLDAKLTEVETAKVAKRLEKYQVTFNQGSGLHNKDVATATAAPPPGQQNGGDHHTVSSWCAQAEFVPS